MRRKNKIIEYSALAFMLCVLGVIIALTIIGFNNGAFSKKTQKQETVADGFTISSYHVLLDVKEDNKIEVTENLMVDFTSSYKHGIYRFVPIWLEYTGKNEKTLKRKATISNLHAVGESYSLDTIKKKEQIQIGNIGEYVNLGEKTYTIKYTYDLGKDPYKGFDEFIFHAFGDYWGTEIKNASIQVNMPKNIEGYIVNFFTDKLRKNNVTDVVDYRVSGNTLYASFNETKNFQKQYDNYCKEQKKQTNKTFCDEEDFYLNYKPLETALTIDIELPEDYFIGGSWNYGWKSFTISVVIILFTLWIIYNWFKFGKDYPKNTPTIEWYPPENLNAAEVGFVWNKGIVSNKCIIALILQLTSKGYIQIDELKDKEQNIQITNLLENKAKNKNMPPRTNLERIVFDRLFEEKNVVILSEHQTFYKVFDEVASEIINNFGEKVFDGKSQKKETSTFRIWVLLLGLSIISYLFIEDLEPNLSILYYISFICVFLDFFFYLFMRRRTRYGEYITAKVKGFRQFLITTEKDKLETLLKENPNYFYEMLPFAYVMDISKKWLRKFENISIPKINKGSFNYGSDSAYYAIYDNIYFPSSSGGDNSSSGCSSCGGGGGGCSSCGGGGSW